MFVAVVVNLHIDIRAFSATNFQITNLLADIVALTKFQIYYMYKLIYADRHRTSVETAG